MDSRSLNRIVVIKRLGGSFDEAGQPIQTWEALASMWANILHLSGLETIKAGAEASIVKASIRALRRTDVTAGMRVHHGAAVYEIKAVLPDEVERERMDLACELINGGA